MLRLQAGEPVSDAVAGNALVFERKGEIRAVDPFAPERRIVIPGGAGAPRAVVLPTNRLFVLDAEGRLFVVPPAGRHVPLGLATSTTLEVFDAVGEVWGAVSPLRDGKTELLVGRIDEPSIPATRIAERTALVTQVRILQAADDRLALAWAEETGQRGASLWVTWLGVDFRPHSEPLRVEESPARVETIELTAAALGSALVVAWAWPETGDGAPTRTLRVHRISPDGSSRRVRSHSIRTVAESATAARDEVDPSQIQAVPVGDHIVLVWIEAMSHALVIRAALAEGGEVVDAFEARPSHGWLRLRAASPERAIVVWATDGALRKAELTLPCERSSQHHPGIRKTAY